MSNKMIEPKKSLEAQSVLQQMRHLSPEEIQHVAIETGIILYPPVVPYGSTSEALFAAPKKTRAAQEVIDDLRKLSPPELQFIKNTLIPAASTPLRQYTHPLNKKSTRKTSGRRRKTHKNKRK
jgi:hypothetical protein